MELMKQETNMPLVSVVMPSYNIERFIEQAVRSVMGQTYTNWELIIVDDCSTDTTYEILQRLAAEEPRIRLIRNAENMGVAKTRDHGLEVVQGSYVALLDSDDIWMSNKLEKQLAKMEETQADLIYTSYEIIDADGEKVKGDYIVPASVDYEHILRENCIGCSTVMAKTQVMRHYKFSCDFYHEDYILWLRMLKDDCKAAGCKEILVKWRFIENSRSFNKYYAARNRWRIYRRFLKLPLWKSVRCFSRYAVGGVHKYFLSGGK